MRRALVVVAAWLGVAGVVTALTWQAVSTIGDRVGGVASAPIRPSEVADAGRDTRQGTTVPTTTLAPPPSGPAVPPASTGPETTGPPPTPPRSVTTSTRPLSPPPSTPPPTLPPAGSSTTTTAAGTTRTYALVGGSVAVRFAPSGATLLWATPNAGFEAEVDQEGGRLKVEFESETHRSELEAWWDGGPRDSVREERRDGHD